MKGDVVANTDYVVEQSITISGIQYIFAIDDESENPYFVGELLSDDIFKKYSNCVVSDDYLSALEEWANRVSEAVAECKSKVNTLEDTVVLTNDDVELITSETVLKNRIIVIKAEVFLRESRESRNQLQFCVGGFGAEPNSRGRAVMCDSVFNGDKRRFNREEVIGVIKADKVPEWAKNKVSEIQLRFDVPVTAKTLQKIKYH